MFKSIVPIIPLFFISSLNAASFSIVGPEAAAIDAASPGRTITLNVTETGTISDLNVAIHLYNTRDIPADPSIDKTMAWGDLNVVLKKDDTEVNLYFDGRPGETSDLFVVLDDEATIFSNLNDLLKTDETNVITQAPTPYNSGQSGIPVYTNSIEASYLPSCSLEAFTGKELSGTWTLTFSDDVVPYENDTLLGWQLFGDTDENAVTLEVASCSENNDIDNTQQPSTTEDNGGGGSISPLFIFGLIGLPIYRRIRKRWVQ